MSFNIGMISLGCAKNRTDSEIMLGVLADRGHNIVPDAEDADVIIVNTCGFIEAAKQESIDTILEMADYKQNRGKLLIVTGCLAERYNEEVLKEFPEINAIVGVSDYHKIADIIDEAEKGERPALYGHMNDDVPEGLPRIITTGGTSAYIKIAEGFDWDIDENYWFTMRATEIGDYLGITNMTALGNNLKKFNVEKKRTNKGNAYVVPPFRKKNTEDLTSPFTKVNEKFNPFRAV